MHITQNIQLFLLEVEVQWIVVIVNEEMIVASGFEDG